jgi:hypothetical protein
MKAFGDGHVRNRLQALPPGKPLFGYRRGKDRYIVDRSTAPVVKDFCDRFLLYGSPRGTVRYLAKKYGKKISVTTYWSALVDQLRLLRQFHLQKRRYHLQSPSSHYFSRRSRTNRPTAVSQPLPSSLHCQFSPLPYRGCWHVGHVNLPRS